MAPHCDLLVIGLGPGGAVAAATAARAGLRVIAVERRREVGIPVQCAEFIPLPLGRWASAPGVVQQRIAAMTTRLPSGVEARSDFPGLMVDRAAFDQALARQAGEAGATLATGTRLVSIDAAARRARVAVGDGERDIRYRLLIAADGPRSTVAHLLGLPRLASVDTRQYTLPLAVAGTDTEVWLSDAYPGGYAWLFPRGRVANLGLGMDPCLDRDMKAPLDRLHRQLAVQGQVGEQVLGRTGGAIPVGGMRESLVHGGALFVGDAAGLTHPITGAGIAPAVVSGERAAHAAAEYLAGANRSALDDYEEDMREQFGASLARAVRRRRWLAARWRTPRAAQDGMHRRGWVAFPEYFLESAGGRAQGPKRRAARAPG